MIERSAENDNDRRNFLKGAGLAVAGAGALSALGTGSASADEASDAAVLNFALNLEYLEAEFYSHAVYGRGLPDHLTTGRGDRGGVVGGREVTFNSRTIRTTAREIARDEIDHVRFLRAALGSAKVSRPKINLRNSFTAAARAAGLVGENETFDPYANENNFLLAAFIFEDVGVTAYKGAAPLITNKAYLEAAAGILAVESYHAGIVRTNLYNKDLMVAARKISGARDSLDGRSLLDQGIGTQKRVNLVPTDMNGIAFSRTPGQVLNVVYLTPKSVNRGGFFPDGVNGAVRRSS
jgi:hypothetical protein